MHIAVTNIFVCNDDIFHHFFIQTDETISISVSQLCTFMSLYFRFLAKIHNFLDNSSTLQFRLLF